MPPAGLEPTIPASKRPQTHTLDRAATGIGSYKRLVRVMFHFVICTTVVVREKRRLREYGETKKNRRKEELDLRGSN
jgi:hypothetical protein